MNKVFTGYRKRDWVIAAVLALFICILFGVQLTPGMVNWGDDFAAYLSEGIALSQGRFHEQIALNGTMYMAELPEEVRQEGLVYVWGFPLLLSLVHRIVGFDPVGYGSIFFYKLPSLLAFGLLAGILYLFYRRFLPWALSVFLTLLLTVNRNFLYSIDILNVDIVFLFSSMLSFLLAEWFFDKAEQDVTLPSVTWLSLLLGISMWYTYETRLNGSTVILMIALGHSFRLLRHKKDYTPGFLLRHACPYLIFLILRFVTEWLLAPATPNTSHVGNVTMELLLSNVSYYYGLTMDFLRELSNYTRFYDVLRYLLVIGFLSRAFRWRNLPYTLLLVGTYVVLILLPYTQGLRYLYGALPFVLLYIGYGCWDLIRLALRLLPVLKKHQRPLGIAASAVTLAVLFSLCLPALRTGICTFRTGTSLAEDDVYTEEAVDMYRYIRENTSRDSVIVFIKTRALYLNTGRVSIYPGIQGHTMDEADYFLYSRNSTLDLDYWLKLEQEAAAPPVYENDVFSLYQIAG